jgi:hypothetical protein
LPVTLTIQTAKGAQASACLQHRAGKTPRAVNGACLRSSASAAWRKVGPQAVEGDAKPLAMLLFAVLSMGAMVGLSGCGGGGFFGATSTSGKYTITVTATSADLVRTSTVQLTIQ